MVASLVPVVIVVALFVMSVFGIGIHQVSLAALTIGGPARKRWRANPAGRRGPAPIKVRSLRSPSRISPRQPLPGGAPLLPGLGPNRRRSGCSPTRPTTPRAHPASDSREPSPPGRHPDQDSALREVARAAHLTKKRAEIIVDTLFRSIAEALHQGQVEARRLLQARQGAEGTDQPGLGAAGSATVFLVADTTLGGKSSLRSAVVPRDSPVRWPAVPGLASLPPLPIMRLPLRVRQHHKTIAAPLRNGPENTANTGPPARRTRQVAGG